MKWLVPWFSIEDDPGQVAAMERELFRELNSTHPLHGIQLRAVGRRQDNDDVLFTFADGTGRVAVVHLTWTHNPPEKPPWPVAVVYSSPEEWAAEGMSSDNKEYESE